MTPLPDVLFESAELLAINKPPARLVIPGRGGGDEPSLREQLEAARGGRKVYVVHRLDRDTSGVLLFALSAEAHRLLNDAFEASRIRKRYGALVRGRLEGTVDLAAPLVPARRNRMRVARPGEPGKEARTRVTARELFSDATWVEAWPLTGRTHQIRVHLASVGHALWVDPQYGRRSPGQGAEDSETTGAELSPVHPDPAAWGLRRTPLHAELLEWPDLGAIPAGCVEAPLWPDLHQALERLRSGA